MKKIIVLLTCLTAGIVFSVNAQTPVVDQRQENQRARIREGVASGELTRQETADARQNQRNIRRVERRVKADGVVTNQERARLHRKQNKTSRELSKDKNDSQARREYNN